MRSIEQLSYAHDMSEKRGRRAISSARGDVQNAARRRGVGVRTGGAREEKMQQCQFFEHATRTNSASMVKKSAEYVLRSFERAGTPRGR